MSRHDKLALSSIERHRLSRLEALLSSIDDDKGVERYLDERRRIDGMSVAIDFAEEAIAHAAKKGKANSLMTALKWVGDRPDPSTIQVIKESIIKAAEAGHPNTLKVLLEWVKQHGFNLSDLLTEKNNALIGAISKCNPEKDSNKDAKDGTQNYNGHVQCVKLLLENGASPFHIDSRNNTLFDLIKLTRLQIRQQTYLSERTLDMFDSIFKFLSDSIRQGATPVAKEPVAERKDSTSEPIAETSVNKKWDALKSSSSKPTSESVRVESPAAPKPNKISLSKMLYSVFGRKATAAAPKATQTKTTTTTEARQSGASLKLELSSTMTGLAQR